MADYDDEFYQDLEQVTKHLRDNDEGMVRIEFIPDYSTEPDDMVRFILEHPDELVASARGNTNVKEALIVGNYEPEEDEEEDSKNFQLYYGTLGRLLGELQSLEKIRIDSFGAGGARSWEALAIILNHTKNRRITSIEFDLNDPAYDDALQGAAAVVDAALLRQTYLEELIVKFEGDLVTDRPLENPLKNPFPRSLAKLPNLHSVRFEIDSKFCLHNFTAPSGSLRRLHFRGIVLDGHLNNSLAQAAARNPHLESIIFEDCTLMGDSAPLLFEKIGELTSLRTLTVDQPCDDIEVYNGLAKFLRNSSDSLTEVRLSVTHPAQTASVAGLYLVLYGGIKTSTPPLVALQLKIQHESLVGGGLLRSCLVGAKALKTLTLKMHQCSNISEGSWRNICSIATENTTLTRLKVVGIPADIDVSQFRQIVSSFKENKKLESLHFSFFSNEMAYEEYLEVLHGLGTDIPLIELDCWCYYPRIPAAEGERLLKALKTVYMLTDFPFKVADSVSAEDKNRMESEAKSIMKLNRHGRRYLVEGKKKERGVALLISVADDLNCVYYHLLENPALCCRRKQDRAPACNAAAVDDDADNGSEGNNRVADGRISKRRRS